MCHMPFGFGPRTCVGMRLALLDAKIALIELLKRYTFIRAPETEVYHNYEFDQRLLLWSVLHHHVFIFLQVPLQLGVGAAIRPKNGIYLKVKERAIQ